MVGQIFKRVFWLSLFKHWTRGHVCFMKSGFRKTIFQTFLYLFVIRKVGQRKIFYSQRKIWLGFQESVFLENLGGKHFSEVVKNLEMSYYLLIISNLVLKLLIAIYIFQFYLLKFNFYINFDSHFYNCYFLIEIFYLSNLILILLIVTYFIWNNLWNVNYYYFNFFIFHFYFIF
jgi:hypothetical protein